MKNRAWRALRAALVCLLALAVCGPAASAASLSARINARTKVYQSASTSARSVTVPKNLNVSLTAASGGWGRVSYKGRTAYIPLKYLTLNKPIRAYVAQSAKVYRRAGSGSLGTAPAGTEVYVVGVSGGYARILSASQKAQGYIRSGALSRTRPTDAGSSSSASKVPSSLRSTTTSASGSKIEYTIYVAQNLLGAPYAASANPPKTFDCAKFAHYCYGKAKSGALKGSSKAQGYDDRYERIDAISDLKRGDLVCFDTIEDSDLCDHVGIYLGGGCFIHASSSAKKVIVSSLKSGYYNRTFSWGRRIFAS